DFDGAESSVELARSLADPDDIEAQVLWRSAQGRILAARGSIDKALECVRTAASQADETSDPALHGEALVDRARVLTEGGRQEEAGPPLREALECFERKVVSVRIETTRRL